jgi:hypothetical protein
MQGQLAPEELAARLREMTSSSQPAAGAAAPRYIVDEPNVPPRIVS